MNIAEPGSNIDTEKLGKVKSFFHATEVSITYRDVRRY